VFFIAVVVTAASATGNAIGVELLDKVVEHTPTVTRAYMDAGFKDDIPIHGAVLGISVEQVKRSTTATGFVPVAKRWAVQRTHGTPMLRGAGPNTADHRVRLAARSAGTALPLTGWTADILALGAALTRRHERVQPRLHVADLESIQPFGTGTRLDVQTDQRLRAPAAGDRDASDPSVRADGL
jgi:hypothetical protein